MCQFNAKTRLAASLSRYFVLNNRCFSTFIRLLPFVLSTHNEMSHKSQECHNTTYKRFSADILLLRKNIDIIVVAGYLIERL
jgi:hypothetical protein